MIPTLDYAPRPSTYSRRLAIWASASFGYPLLVAACLYGEWLLAWVVLGHPPRPSLDDPQSIPGACVVHLATALILAGSFPAAAAGLALNVIYVLVNQIAWPRAALRVVVFLLLWSVLVSLLRWDPGQVVCWWFD